MLNSINPVSARYNHTPAFKGIHKLTTPDISDNYHAGILKKIEDLVGAKNVLVSTGRADRPVTKVGIPPTVGLVEIRCPDSFDNKVMREIERIMKNCPDYIKSKNYVPLIRVWIAIIFSLRKKSIH